MMKFLVVIWEPCRIKTYCPKQKNEQHSLFKKGTRETKGNARTSKEKTHEHRHGAVNDTSIADSGKAMPKLMPAKDILPKQTAEETSETWRQGRRKFPRKNGRTTNLTLEEIND